MSEQLTPEEARAMTDEVKRMLQTRPTRVKHPVRRDVPTDVYEMYDAAGKLLYVGLSMSTPGRMAAHRHAEDFWLQVARIEVSHCATRDEASTLERERIAAGAPLYNRNGGGA